MLKHDEREIDGLTVKVVQFAGQRNFDVLLDLARLVGPALGAATKGYDESKSPLEQDLDLQAVADAIFGSFEKRAIQELVSKLLESTFVEDRPILERFDEVFAGPHIWRLPRVLLFVLEVNFGGFSELGASITSLHGARAGKAEPTVRDG